MLRCWFLFGSWCTCVYLPIRISSSTYSSHLTMLPTALERYIEKSFTIDGTHYRFSTSIALSLSLFQLHFLHQFRTYTVPNISNIHFSDMLLPYLFAFIFYLIYFVCTADSNFPCRTKIWALRIRLCPSMCGWRLILPLLLLLLLLLPQFFRLVVKWLHTDGEWMKWPEHTLIQLAIVFLCVVFPLSFQEIQAMLERECVFDWSFGALLSHNF